MLIALIEWHLYLVHTLGGKNIIKYWAKNMLCVILLNGLIIDFVILRID